LLSLVSCSSDENSSESTSRDLLLKQIIEGDAILGGSMTDFTYDGNKLVEIKRNIETDVYSDIYTYTGDVITKIEKFQIHYAGTPDEEIDLISTDEFQYDANNQLIQFKTTSPDSDIERVTTYTYNSGNTISLSQYENSPGNAPELLKTGTITLQNGEIAQLQIVKEFDSYTDNYTYDTKNSVFKNVLGYDKLLLTHIIGQQGSMTIVDTIIGGVSHNFTNHDELEYTYNSDNYPITADQSWFGSVMHTFEFIYY
jgi:hypothetical protein